MGQAGAWALFFLTRLTIPGTRLTRQILGGFFFGFFAGLIAVITADAFLEIPDRLSQAATDLRELAWTENDQGNN